MRRSLVFCAMLGVALACSRQRESEPASSPPVKAGFVDRVWTVVESPGGPGDLYVFLSDGTFVKAAKEAVPTVGKWSWDGKQLTVIESALPYTADIDSLTGTYLKLTIHFMNKSYVVGLVPATPSMPDTVRTVEFNPAQASINAMGKNPAWLFAVDNDRAMLRTAKDGTLYYEDGEWVQDCAAVWDYSAHRKFAGGEETIEMQLSTETCVDSTSGAESPLTAILIRGEKSWYGCAVAGKLQTSQSPDPRK
jgi:uncharacterized membrane protein